MFAMLLGYEVPGWAGWVAAALGTVMYVWGGRPFLTGAVSELKSRKPGMMLLIALAITVAFFASWAATLGLVHHELEFWWELALLIVIMLLGHWIEMRSLAQTTSALDSLAALLPDEAERVEGEKANVYLMLDEPKLDLEDGERGSLVWQDAVATEVAPRRVEVVYDIGAGDAFHAGFVAAHLAGKAERWHHARPGNDQVRARHLPGVFRAQRGVHAPRATGTPPNRCRIRAMTSTTPGYQ